MSKRIDQELMEATLEAIVGRSKLPCYFHTDQGSEYQSEEHLSLLQSKGVTISMSKKSSPWQNGYQESFYSQFKLELGSLNHLSTDGEVTEAIYRQIYYYNHLRIHTTIKMQPRRFYLEHLDKSV